jgi:hypothetical protein
VELEGVLSSNWASVWRIRTNPGIEETILKNQVADMKIIKLELVG